MKTVWIFAEKHQYNENWADGCLQTPEILIVMRQIWNIIFFFIIINVDAYLQTREEFSCQVLS